jgi:hypothetical protein
MGFDWSQGTMECKARVDVAVSISMLAYEEEDIAICERMNSFKLLEMNLFQYQNFCPGHGYGVEIDLPITGFAAPFFQSHPLPP